MRLPPRWVRRLLAVLLVPLLAVVLVLLPVLLLGSAVASWWAPGRLRPLRVVVFLAVFLLLEVVGLAAALVLWVATGLGRRLRAPWSLRAHYAVLHGLLAVVEAVALRLFRVRVRTDGAGWSPLDDGVPGSENAMVVLSRHAGPGDSFLLVRTLLDRDHLRRPRIVLKDTLQLDPLVDVYLNRLPSAWIPSHPRPGDDPAAAVGRLATGLGTEDALLIFPEGGNFTAARRTRAIDALRRKGLVEEADRAEAMSRVLPPRPGGVAAALAAAPHADVVFVAHTGLERFSTVRDLWAGIPMDRTLHLRWDFVPAADVPRDREEQADWLFEEWAEIDAWIGSRGG